MNNNKNYIDSDAEHSSTCSLCGVFKGCDSNFEIKVLKITSYETTTLHHTICTRKVLEIYYNNDQQFN